jgi:hypothetical protein
VILNDTALGGGRQRERRVLDQVKDVLKEYLGCEPSGVGLAISSVSQTDVHVEEAFIEAFV